jgi:hypothetical protein
VLLGGANTGGLTGQVQLLHSVAAQQGQLLQARLLQLVEELSAAQQQGVQGDADLECWRLQAAQHEQQLRVSVVVSSATLLVQSAGICQRVSNQLEAHTPRPWCWCSLYCLLLPIHPEYL